MTLPFESRVYVDGEVVARATTVAEACEQRARHGGLNLLLLDGPGAADMERIGAEFGLPAMALEDAWETHQRAKFDRYGETAFVVLRPARYDDAEEAVELGEVHLFIGPDYTVVVRHGPVPEVDALADRLAADPWLTTRGGLGVLYAVLDHVVDAYGPVLDGLEKDVDEIEDQVFGGDRGAARRIYQLSREAIDLHRAVDPLQRVVAQAGLAASVRAAADADTDMSGEDLLEREVTRMQVDEMHMTDLAGDELRARIAEVTEHLVVATDRVGAVRAALADILQTNATLVGLDQNARMETLAEAGFEQDMQVKRISSWAAILIAPSLLAGLAGMDVGGLPGRGHPLGFAVALGLMIAVSVGLYVRFRRIGWL